MRSGVQLGGYLARKAQANLRNLLRFLRRAYIQAGVTIRPHRLQPSRWHRLCFREPVPGCFTDSLRDLSLLPAGPGGMIRGLVVKGSYFTMHTTLSENAPGTKGSDSQEFA